MKIYTAVISLLFLCFSSFGGINDGLVLYYDFDVDQGAQAVDQSCAANDGTIGGALRVADGACGDALQFDGLDDEVVIPNDESLNPTNEVTVAAWFKCMGPGTHNGIILLKGGTPHSGLDVGQYALIYFPNNAQGVMGKVSFSLRRANAGWWQDFYSDSVLATGVWYHVAGTYKSGALNLYVNGELARPTANLTGPIKIYPGDLCIGAEHAFPNNEYFKGMIDEVRVYDRCLSADEVRQLWRVCAADVPCEGPCITQIGFSNDPRGDQDVTVFYRDETLYIRVKDVSLESVPVDCVRVRLKQPKRNGAVWTDLVLGADKWFTGSVPLGGFKPGTVNIRIFGISGGANKLIKDAQIRVLKPSVP